MKKLLCIKLQTAFLMLENQLMDILIGLSKQAIRLCVRSITLMEAIHVYQEEAKK